MSMMSAPASSATLAPSLIQCAWQRGSCTTGGPMPAASQRNREIGRPCARSSLAVISETTRPAPSLAASRRKGASVTPDMGASRTLLARAISPTFKGLGLNSSELVTNLRLSDRRHIAAAVVYCEHISCGVKFHAYTLDNSSHLASAVQQNLLFLTA